jgi:formylmethanofuran dehydrogenase subunit E
LTGSTTGAILATAREIEERRTTMVECQKCGAEFYNETDPLATICRDCAQERETDLAEGEATGN